MTTTNPCREWQEFTCNEWYEDYHDVPFQNKLDAPKPWIGMYIVAATAACATAVAVDVFSGFKTKKIWFPCKYFSLNATSLTLLAIAMKLTMDLTSTKLGLNDSIAGYSSVVLMSSAMGTFMTSLASMNDKDIILNLTALGILVVTVVINMWVFNIQLHKAFGGFELSFDDIVCCFILLLLLMLCTSAIAAPTMKRYIETKFLEIHREVLRERGQTTKFKAQELKTTLKKYWVMAGTGNPQFVMARSVVCVIPGLVCLSMTITLLVFALNPDVIYDDFFHSDSVYKWSMSWILIIQTLGAILATIAPTSRLFVAAIFRSSKPGLKSFMEEMKTETYWTRSLVDWRECPIPLRIRSVKCRRFLHLSKRGILNICITLQVTIVVISKLILIISSWFINVPFVRSVNKIGRHVFRLTSDERRHVSGDTNELDFSPYVLLLEGELELPRKIIANISSEAEELIKVGKMRKPENIIELLRKSENFNGVRKIITSLHAQEPRNCWSLSVVTLTKIAVALPNVSIHDVNKLCRTVSEGLRFVKFIEKKIDTREELRSIIITADFIWVRDLDKKWHDSDVVQRNNMGDETYKATLRELSTKALSDVTKFKSSPGYSAMDNPVNWPTEVIAANSMYRVCESLLLIDNDGITTEIFEQLSIIISDILAACLTNLAQVMFSECHSNSIEKRQESTRRALVLFGESEEIIECLEQRDWPNLDPDKAGYIEEWQAIMELNNENPVNSVSTTYDTSTPQSSDEQLIVRVES